MDYAVVIPTNRSFEAIEPLLRSLVTQSFLPKQLVIIRDIVIEINKYGKIEDNYRELQTDYSNRVRDIFCNMVIQVDIVDELSTSTFKAGNGASYVRNFGRKQVVCEYMMFIDDDNVVDNDGCEKMLRSGILNFSWSGGVSCNIQFKKNTIIVPRQGNGNTNTIRNAEAKGFNFLTCRPNRLVDSDVLLDCRYIPITLASSNCLVGPTQLFEKYPFDETIPFVYEDLIMTGQMSTDGVQLLCDTEVLIHHYHTHRSKLAELYINTPERAYYKAKHRIILVHTVDRYRWQLVLFYVIGLWGHSAWLALHIVRYAPISERKGLLFAMVRGSLHGVYKICCMS